MKKRILGRTDIGVSELCLGTLNFGWKTNRETSFAILDHFRSEGGNFIQCNGVLPQLPDAATWIALSEIYVGEWLTRRAMPRREIFLATRASVHPPRGMSGAEQLRQSCENSLQRLGVDHVDLLVCHSHSPSVPLDELLLEMTKLVQSGKVRYFAMERCPLWRVMESIDRARRKNFCRLEALQA
ncbi:MAG TPA: aldo/keto reductase, partial [Acidovorax sp.]|nr:aldo/keto reductase [Acidovorax sp.]